MRDKAKETPEKESLLDDTRFLSHQLQSPMDSIHSLLNMISEGITGESNPKTLYFIEQAVTKISEAKETIANLLDYDLYSQEQPAWQNEVELVMMMHTLVNNYVSRAAEKNIFLHTDLPLTQKIFILGDSRGLQHAFRNLIENAIKYTPEQGSVTFTLGISEGEKRCHITISDTGYGISENELENIFEPFYRSMKHKSTISGTGLGLPIVKRVITQHRGTVTVTSKENAGTTFSIVLPYVRLEMSEEAVTEKKKILIIGGVTAGPKAIARLRRLDEDLDITIVEKDEFLSYCACALPLYVTDKVHSSRALISTADTTIRDVNFFESIENITVLNNTVALEIDREHKMVKTQNLQNKRMSELPYDVLILATGSESFVPKIPGIWQKGIYSLNNLEQADAIKIALSFEKTQDVSIIGGGLMGISAAESLIEPGLRVTILEEKPHILFNLMDQNIAVKIQHELRKKGVKIITKLNIAKIERVKEHLLIMTTENDAYYADLMILATDLKPNTVLAKQAGLEIGDTGGIRVSASLQTTDEHIYAVGNCAESINPITKKHEYWPLGSVSTKMGRIAADNICGRQPEFQGSIGTVMFKIIDINVARTGLTVSKAREDGFDAETVIVSGLDRAHYYDNAKYIVLKVIADRKTKILLGAQGYGKGEVVSKIQLLASAITRSLTLDDVFNLDLGYAPAFNTPLDIVQTACLVLKNKIEKLFKTITVEEFEQEQEHIRGIIDVSPFSEHTFRSIPGSINIPLENLRREEIPFEKDATVILYSKTSAGAYKAYRYLTSKGYANLLVLEGGYIGWEK